MFNPSKINALVNRQSNGICQSNILLLYKKTSCFILVDRDFMSQILKIVLTVHCVSIRSIKSKESFRICLIKKRVGSIITCKICETTLVWFFYY